jgi:predicted solute-binding protein
VLDDIDEEKIDDYHICKMFWQSIMIIVRMQFEDIKSIVLQEIEWMIRLIIAEDIPVAHPEIISFLIGNDL